MKQKGRAKHRPAVPGEPLYLHTAAPSLAYNRILIDAAAGVGIVILAPRLEMFREGNRRNPGTWVS
jgi:hypothetical protein